MYSFCSLHRPPRARCDVIDTERVALSLMAMSVADPPRHETLAVLLDDQLRGSTILSVADTVEPDALFDVVDLISDVNHAGDELGAVVLATVRPGGAADPGDVDRWLEASSMLADAGIELLEWFVFDATGVMCPRDLLGEPPRWPS